MFAGFDSRHEREHRHDEVSEELHGCLDGCYVDPEREMIGKSVKAMKFDEMKICAGYEV